MKLKALITVQKIYQPMKRNDKKLGGENLVYKCDNKCF